jgi:hypothetical protein
MRSSLMRCTVLHTPYRPWPEGRHPAERGPQRVTVHGRHAVVFVRAEEFDCMQRAMMASSPLADVDFERLSVKSPVRDVDLLQVPASLEAAAEAAAASRSG